MKFVTWGMHSDQEVEVPDGESPDDVNPKSGIRNAIFEAIARGGHVKILKRADIPGEGENQPVEMERYDYKFNAGLSKVTRARQPKKRGSGYTDWKVVNREFVTDDPEEIVHILYGGEANAYDIMTPRDAWDALVDSEMWEDPETRKEIARCFDGVMKQHPNLTKPNWIEFN